MAVQIPNNATIEQIIRALGVVAQHVEPDVQLVASQMSTATFRPAALVDGAGNEFTVSMVDIEQGVAADPTEWIQASFARVIRTSGLRVAPPYPSIQFLTGPGSIMTTIDQTGSSLVSYSIDAVVAAYSDRPTQATQRAQALTTAFNTLVLRNSNLGGLVSLIKPNGTPVESGEARQSPGLVAGWMQRYEAIAWSLA